MTSKYSFVSLCKKYSKIEVPIIQRNYAQGRVSSKETQIRNKFVAYLADKLVANTPVELDFIYGNVRMDIIEGEGDEQSHANVFIPIDGQQRLTTLFLLHWYLAVKDGKLEELRPILSKFVYETRPSAHSFCAQLVERQYTQDCLNDVNDFLIDQTWFDNDWLNDGTVSGMLQMLKAFSCNKNINSPLVHIYQLLEPCNIISFYFVPLEKFGLSDELYVRMNARGKILTDFENFKSEFYKIISYHPELETIQDKMEYLWVENLWNYLPNKKFVTDDCFMNILQFVTEMLYFKQAKIHDENGYADDFLDFMLLKDLFFKKENADFLFFVLDKIHIMSISSINKILWDKQNQLSKSVADILSDVIKGKSIETEEKFVLYCAFEYIYMNNSTEGLDDYIRVVRNLVVNTPDKSNREWPRIIKSLQALSSGTNVYSRLSIKPSLLGLRNEQCNEEIFKGQLFFNNPDYKNKFQMIEDNGYFKGNVTNIIAVCYVKNESDIKDFQIENANVADFSIDRLSEIYNSYIEISKEDFNIVFGDLINTSLYTHYVSSSRLMHDDDYSKNSAVIAMATDFCDSQFDNLEDYLISIEKAFVNKLSVKYEDFSMISDVKVQLRLLYIMTLRLMNKDYQSFFKDSWNFGWLTKENGFTSLFHNGIEGDTWWSEPSNNPIFQTYNWQFRYNSGLNKAHALEIEIVGSGRPQKPFERIIEWAK